MNTNPDRDRLLDRVEPARRDSLRRLLQGGAAGTALYNAPLVTSFSMDTLEGVANAATVPNQLPVVSVPASSGWGIAALIGMVSAAGAFLARRRGRDRQS